MSEPSTPKFSFTKRAHSLIHAGRGIVIFIRTTHNAWVQLVLLVLVVFLGAYLHISHTDWSLLVLASGMVLAAEAFNTAIEIGMDHTSPEIHPLVRNTKDIAAGAVLLTAIAAALIGILIFAPHLYSYVF